MDGAGTISGRWALATGRAAIKGCRICQGPTLPGMRLCTQCKAALKRARQETVSELIPAPPLRAPAARSRRGPKAEPAVEAAPPRARSTLGGARATAIVLSVVAAMAVGYAALRFARAVPATLPAPPVASTAAPAAPAPGPAARPEPAAPVARQAPTLFVAPASASRLVRAPAPKRAPEAAPAALPPEPPATARFAAATEPPAAPPVAAPPASSPAPKPNRWQLMAEALAQCGRDGFLAGVICDQRTRLQYCEGYWGQVAQCPNGIPNDHGQ